MTIADLIRRDGRWLGGVEPTQYGKSPARACWEEMQRHKASGGYIMQLGKAEDYGFIAKRPVDYREVAKMSKAKIPAPLHEYADIVSKYTATPVDAEKIAHDTMRRYMTERESLFIDKQDVNPKAISRLIRRVARNYRMSKGRSAVR